MRTPTKIGKIECYGEAYLGQNYYVKFDDEEQDYICATIEAENWTNVVRALKARHPGQEILEIEAC